MAASEVVYKCDSCNRSVRVPSDRHGLDIVDGCIITHGCAGSLLLVTDIRDRSSAAAFPADVRGLNNWVQRKIIHDHIQPSKSSNWLIQHELASDPLFYVYKRVEAVASDVRPRPSQEGVLWFKTANRIDENNPSDPAVFGLYQMVDGAWFRIMDHINGTMKGDDEYQCDVQITPKSIVPIDENTTRLLFDEKISGVVQAVASASKQDYQAVSQRQRTKQIASRLGSYNGEMVIAIAGDPTSVPSATISFTMYGPSSNNLTASASYGNGLYDPSVNSAWFGIRGVFINGIAYRLASVFVAQLFPTSAMIDNGIEPEQAFFSVSTEPRSYIVLSDVPHGPTDRVYSTAVPFHFADKNGGLYLSHGEVTVPDSLTQTIYPPLSEIR